MVHLGEVLSNVSTSIAWGLQRIVRPVQAPVPALLRPHVSWCWPGRLTRPCIPLQEDVRENIAYHMAFAHQSVAEASKQYLESVRRYNYTTPKSYLELINLYKQLLGRKRDELRQDKERLENGVTKIAQASAQVS